MNGVKLVGGGRGGRCWGYRLGGKAAVWHSSARQGLRARSECSTQRPVAGGAEPHPMRPPCGRGASTQASKQGSKEASQQVICRPAHPHPAPPRPPRPAPHAGATSRPARSGTPTEGTGPLRLSSISGGRAARRWGWTTCVASGGDRGRGRGLFSPSPSSCPQRYLGDIWEISGLPSAAAWP